jgi:hypothetical protein
MLRNLTNKLAIGCLTLLIALPLCGMNKPGEQQSNDDAARPAWLPKFVTCSDSPLYVQSNMSAAIMNRQAEVIGKLHPTPLINSPNVYELECGLLVKPWKYSPNGFIAVFETAVLKPSGSGGASEEYRTLSVGLVTVAKDGNSVAVDARTAQPYRLEQEVRFDRFDLAAYQLTESETAFGLRTIKNTMYAGGGGADEYLELFRINNGVVVPILSTLMISTALEAGEWRKDGTREHHDVGNEKGAFIRVLKVKSNGFFDLEKYLSNGKHAIFHWNGKAYATTDPDPLKSVN